MVSHRPNTRTNHQNYISRWLEFHHQLQEKGVVRLHPRTIHRLAIAGVEAAAVAEAVELAAAAAAASTTRNVIGTKMFTQCSYCDVIICNVVMM